MNTISDALRNTFKIDNSNVKPSYSNGCNIEGVVKNKSSEGTLIEVMNKEIMVPSEINIKEDVGEKCSFQLEETKGDKVRLKYISKEINSVSNKRPSLSNIWNKNITMNKEMMDIITSLQNKDKKIIDEYESIINTTKKQLEQLFSKVTDEDILEIINKDYDPEKITIDLFEKIISNNKLAVTNNDTKKIKEEVDKELERYAKIFGSKEEIKSIIKELKEKNLPVTEYNIMKIRSTLNKFDAIKDLKDEAILNVLRNNIELTVEKVYEAKYSSGKVNNSHNTYGSSLVEQNNPPISDHELKHLEPQIEKIFKRENIEINNNTLETAKTFIKNDMEINKEDIEKYLYIKDIKKNINPKQIIDKAVDNIIHNNKIDDIKLDETYKENKIDNTIENNNKDDDKIKDKMKNDIKSKKILHNLPKIKDDNIKSLIKNNEDINLSTLEKELNNNESSNNDLSNKKDFSQEQQKEYITAKRQLEEIRLKMTIESANRLLNNGIKIDTAPLNELVKELRKIEEVEIKKELSGVGVENSKTNVSKMEEVLTTLEKTKNTSANILGKVMNKTVDFTLKAMTSNGETNTISNNQLEMYDKLGTKPRADLGDNIKKAFGQLEKILNDLGIEASNKNLRAAKILSHNEMEISINNINNIKVIDQKVNMILNRLHPSIVAHMIKDNLSPIDMDVNEVIEYMDDFDELLGEDLNDKIGKYIHEMDKSNSLSEKERKSMIGIYRMLNTISKSEGRAVGFLIKKDLEMTLNNLMEAAKYIRRNNGKKTDINVSIDDSYGVLETLKYDSETARQQIQEAFEKAGLKATNNVKLIDAIEEFELKITEDTLIDMKYLENNLKELIRKASPNNLKRILEDNKIMDKSIDEIIDFIDENKEFQEVETKQIRDQLNQIRNVSGEAIKFLEELQMPINLKNLNTIDNLLQNNNELSNKLKNLMNEIKESSIDSDIINELSTTLDDLHSGEDIQLIYSQLQKELREIKGKTFQLNRNKRINISDNLKDINRIIDINKELENKEDYIQIPIMLNGEITQLNMYYMEKNKTEGESLKVLLSLNTKNIGIVHSLISMNNEEIHLNISSSIDQETTYIKKFDKDLRDILGDIGYDKISIEYESKKIETPLDSHKKVIQNKGIDKKGSFEISI
ncbi:MAG: DUF6240 domain-containing protein [Vallitalea sp.]|jgi:hypothetical protein|nr:DUF6240 domain-containing protein [Vallitalea sp.]